MSARSLSTLRRNAAGCRACPLWENATRTVFGEGRVQAAVMPAGEQPGDHEDLRAGERRAAEMASFVEDLRLVASVL